MPSPREPINTFVEPPDPGQARTNDDLVEQLRLLKVWAGDPSYESITGRVNAAWTAAGRPARERAGKTTVVDCFRSGRRRLNIDLVVAVVEALHPDVGYVTQWRQALQVIGGEAAAASQVRVQDTLPQDLPGFTGRTAELDQLRQVLHHARQSGGAVVISAIDGMAGVGKTQLAIHTGHLLIQDKRFDRVLFVNLRGFHPEPAQPPADPAAVLDGFLRLLSVPGHKIPHDLHARAAVYRDRLAGTQTLVVLDNAANEEQVRPLLPETPGCLTFVTSRRSLADLRPAAHLTLDVFTPDEALRFLTRATPQIPLGPDPDAPTRIARRCGYLPLALGLVTGQIRGTPGWTLTDHADRLDERHYQRLDTGVELALDLSYRHLTDGQRRLLRLAALHPGHDFDDFAAAALTGDDLPTARTHLEDLYHDHLLQKPAPDRYSLHDLVRGYAGARASDEDPPSQRRIALTRLFDYYLVTTAAAMNTLHPAEAHRRPHIPPPDTPTPALPEPDTARAWLDTERPNLVAVAAHTATHGWPTHTTRLSTTLHGYLNSGHHTDALAIHDHAHHAAQHTEDLAGQARALTNLGTAYGQLARYRLAAEHLQQALDLFQQTGDLTGLARALNNLGNLEQRLGRYRQAADHHEQALTLYRQASDRVGEASSLNNLAVAEHRLGSHRRAADHFKRALTLYRQTGDRYGEANTLENLGGVEALLDRYQLATEHLQHALTLFRDLGHRRGQAWTLNSLGTLHTRRGQAAEATHHYEQARIIFRQIGVRDGEAWALNGLGETAHAAGRHTDALTHHQAARTIASDIGDRDQHARAHTGLGHVHHALGGIDHARHHYRHALDLYTQLDIPEADHVRAHLTAINHANPTTA